MTNQEAIKFGKEQLEIFGEDSQMSEFIRLAIKALEERPKGKWIEETVPIALVGKGNGQYRCSNCGHRDIQAKTQEVPYCWWCGARMER